MIKNGLRDDYGQVINQPQYNRLETSSRILRKGIIWEKRKTNSGYDHVNDITITTAGATIYAYNSNFDLLWSLNYDSEPGRWIVGIVVIRSVIYVITEYSRDLYIASYNTTNGSIIRNHSIVHTDDDKLCLTGGLICGGDIIIQYTSSYIYIGYGRIGSDGNTLYLTFIKVSLSTFTSQRLDFDTLLNNKHSMNNNYNVDYIIASYHNYSTKKITLIKINDNGNSQSIEVDWSGSDYVYTCLTKNLLMIYSLYISDLTLFDTSLNMIPNNSICFTDIFFNTRCIYEDDNICVFNNGLKTNKNMTRILDICPDTRDHYNSSIYGLNYATYTNNYSFYSKNLDRFISIKENEVTVYQF